MVASQIRKLGAILEARLMSSWRKKGKGRTRPSTSATVAPLIAIVTLGEDISYLPLPTTVLEAILHDVPLLTNAEMPLPAIGSP